MKHLLAFIILVCVTLSQWHDLKQRNQNNTTPGILTWGHEWCENTELPIKYFSKLKFLIKKQHACATNRGVPVLGEVIYFAAPGVTLRSRVIDTSSQIIVKCLIGFLDHFKSVLRAISAGLKGRLIRWGEEGRCCLFLGSGVTLGAGSTLHPITLAGPEMEGGKHSSPDNTRHSTRSLITGLVMVQTLIYSQGLKLHKNHTPHSTQLPGIYVILKCCDGWASTHILGKGVLCSLSVQLLMHTICCMHECILGFLFKIHFSSPQLPYQPVDLSYSSS